MPKTIDNIDDSILKLLSIRNQLTINELSEIFNYSVPVIRRICRKLAEKSDLQFKRGELSYINSEISQKKRLIAQTASTYIKEGDTIFFRGWQYYFSFVPISS